MATLPWGRGVHSFRVRKLRRLCGGLVGAAFLSLVHLAPAHGAFVIFDNFSSTNADGLTPTVTVHQIIEAFRVNIALASGQSGDLYGFFLDLDGRSLGLGLSTVIGDIMNFNPSVPGGIADFEHDVIGLHVPPPGSPSVNLEGSFTPAVDESNFEVAFSIDPTPVPSVGGFSFDIKDQSGAVIMDDFSRIGLRLVNSSNTGGSDKLISSTARIAPLPAGFALYGTGLVALGLVGWLRRRAAAL